MLVSALLAAVSSVQGVPPGRGAEPLSTTIALLSTSREAGSSFVTVLKDCGAAGAGPLSFPQPGASLALDVPISGRAGAKTRELVDSLNDFVVAHGGRVYLAKDAFTKPEHFRRMYPRLAEFEALRAKWDPRGALSSAQSQRLLGS